jgi:uncharacterized protein YehS (DUF1456 family)
MSRVTSKALSKLGEVAKSQTLSQAGDEILSRKSLAQSATQS